jgi:hypothetical protein
MSALRASTTRSLLLPVPSWTLPLSILTKYEFKDPHGRTLERCVDYQDLLELERLRLAGQG